MVSIYEGLLTVSDDYYELRQDLHAFLTDNYFILTRDEEHGKHIVVSRVGCLLRELADLQPIHLDFLNLTSADSLPEKRYDFVSQYRRRPGANMYASAE